MKHYFLTTATVALSLMGSVLVPALNADELNKSTTITIDQSIDVQGIVLPAGSYVIKRLRSSTDPRTVQLFNAAENHLITTVLALAAYRVTPTDDSKFTFYEVAPGQPSALHTWFYPGDLPIDVLFVGCHCDPHPGPSPLRQCVFGLCAIVESNRNALGVRVAFQTRNRRANRVPVQPGAEHWLQGSQQGSLQILRADGFLNARSVLVSYCAIIDLRFFARGRLNHHARFRR